MSVVFWLLSESKARAFVHTKSNVESVRRGRINGIGSQPEPALDLIGGWDDSLGLATFNLLLDT